MTVVARGADALGTLGARLGVATICADVTDQAAAKRILAEVRPDMLVLNAGATPLMGRLDPRSEAAYRRAGERGFVPGEELADWLAAEREVAADKPGPNFV